jgi:hypothetical protein
MYSFYLSDPFDFLQNVGLKIVVHPRLGWSKVVKSSCVMMVETFMVSKDKDLVRSDRDAAED